MNKKKNSLKKVYESLFNLPKEYLQEDIIKEFQIKKNSKNITNSKTLKDLYDKYNITDSDDFINQVVPTEIPGLGTFDLTPVQIGLIGCIDQYCYGDNILALKLINILKSGVINESKVKDSLKLKKPKDFNLNYEYTIMFLDECKNNFILDENYNIIEGTTISQKEYQISEANGFLFELFLCYNITDFFGKDKIGSKNIRRLSSYKNVSYISTILSVIYNLINYDQAVNVYINTDYRYLYDNIFNKEDNVFKILIDETINYNDLFFDFKKGGAPIDVYIRKNNIDGEIISAIDLKTSLLGKEKSAISTSHTSLNNQINKIVIENKEKGSIKDFNICLFNLSCTYNKNNFTIDKKSCKYISFIENYYNIYERILKNQTREFSFTEDDNYLTIENSNKHPITFNLKNISDELIQKNIDAAKKTGFNEIYAKKQINKFLDKLKLKINNIFKSGQKILNKEDRKSVSESIRINLGSGSKTVSNDGKYNVKRISKLGIFFKENQKYIETLYQELYEYIQEEFEKDPISVEFYYNILDIFTKQAKKIYENLREKEIIAKSEEQKKFLLQFIDNKHKRPREYSNEEAISMLIGGINKVVSGVIEYQNISYQNGQLKYLIGSHKPHGYLGEHFKKNPSDLIAVYNIIFEQFNSKPDLSENYQYYDNVLYKIYNNMKIVIEDFNLGKEKNEKIDLKSFNKKTLNYINNNNDNEENLGDSIDKNESLMLSNKNLLQEIYKHLF